MIYSAAECFFAKVTVLQTVCLSLTGVLLWDKDPRSTALSETSANSQGHENFDSAPVTWTLNNLNIGCRWAEKQVCFLEKSENEINCEKL